MKCDAQGHEIDGGMRVKVVHRKRRPEVVGRAASQELICLPQDEEPCRAVVLVAVDDDEVLNDVPSGEEPACGADTRGGSPALQATPSRLTTGMTVLCRGE